MQGVHKLIYLLFSYFICIFYTFYLLHSKFVDMNVVQQENLWMQKGYHTIFL